jgi:hypothetical protein
MKVLHLSDMSEVRIKLYFKVMPRILGDGRYFSVIYFLGGWKERNVFCFLLSFEGCRKQFCLLWLPELWILRYPARRYHVVPSPGFEPTTLWLQVRHPNHSITMVDEANNVVEMCFEVDKAYERIEGQRS